MAVVLVMGCGASHTTAQQSSTPQTAPESERREHGRQVELERIAAERRQHVDRLLEEQRREERDQEVREQRAAAERRVRALEERRQNEQERATAERHAAQVKAAEDAFSNALKTAREDAIASMLKKRGFLMLSFGLQATLAGAVQSATPIARIKQIAIQLTPADGELRISQVMGHTGLVHAGDVKLLVPGKPGSVYQGTLVSELGATTYKVTDLVTYQSLLGPQQAFRLQAIEQFDVEGVAWVSAAKAMIRPDNTLTLALIQNGELHECMDLRVGQTKDWKPMPDSIAVEHPCLEAFQRPILGRCELGAVTTYGYPGQSVALGSEGACAKHKGVWTPAARSEGADEGVHATSAAVPNCVTSDDCN